MVKFRSVFSFCKRATQLDQRTIYKRMYCHINICKIGHLPGVGTLCAHRKTYTWAYNITIKILSTNVCDVTARWRHGEHMYIKCLCIYICPYARSALNPLWFLYSLPNYLKIIFSTHQSVLFTHNMNVFLRNRIFFYFHATKYIEGGFCYGCVRVRANWNKEMYLMLCSCIWVKLVRVWFLINWIINECFNFSIQNKIRKFLFFY